MNYWFRQPTQIRGTLIRHYIGIFTFVIASFLVSLLLFVVLFASQLVNKEDGRNPGDTELVMFVKDRMESGLQASQIAAPDIQEIEAGQIVRLNGWVEVLSETNEIIRVIGTKQTETKRYTHDQLIEILSNDNDQPYFSTIASVTSDKGHPNRILVQLPRSSVLYHLAPSVTDPNPMQAIAVSFLISLLVFFIILGLAIFFYGRWTARSISKPFYLITEGIQKMTRGHYDTRLSFDAEAEFEQIRDAFNYMVQQLQIKELEKRKIEASKQRMLVDITHDLNTPLTTVMSYAKALHDGIVEDEDKKQRYLKMIQDKAQRMSNLINNIQVLSKLERTEFLLEKKRGNIVEFVRQIIAEHYGEFEDNAFELDLQLPDEEILLKFDHTQMARVMSNLIYNALKYNPIGTLITIAVQRTETNVEILIADTGVGIDESLQSAIFEPFVRGDDARLTTGGLGLGLAISKVIVEKHGGRMALLRETRHSTAFSILLPAT